jgi:hypothetical protein
MLKRFSLVVTLVLSIFIIISGCNLTKNVELNVEPPEPQFISMVFATALDENQMPVSTNFEFDEFEEFLIFFDSNLPFGMDEFTVTVYEIDENFESHQFDEALLEIDKTWNTGFIPISLPEGHYEIEVYFHDGLSVSREVIING